MTKDDLLELHNLLSTSQEDAVLFVENKLQVRSKNKRIRKKIRKQIITQLSDLAPSENPTEESVEASPITVDVSSLPVTFLLSLGKDHFADLDVVKYYYSKAKDKQEYNKNKELLIESLNKAIQEASPAEQQVIIGKIEEKQK